MKYITQNSTSCKHKNGILFSICNFSLHNGKMNPNAPTKIQLLYRLFLLTQNFVYRRIKAEAETNTPRCTRIITSISCIEFFSALGRQIRRLWLLHHKVKNIFFLRFPLYYAHIEYVHWILRMEIYLQSPAPVLWKRKQIQPSLCLLTEYKWREKKKKSSGFGHECSQNEIRHFPSR